MKKKKLVFTDEEKARRRKLKLPITKQLRYMKRMQKTCAYHGKMVFAAI